MFFPFPPFLSWKYVVRWIWCFLILFFCTRDMMNIFWSFVSIKCRPRVAMLFSPFLRMCLWCDGPPLPPLPEGAMKFSPLSSCLPVVRLIYMMFSDPFFVQWTWWTFSDSLFQLNIMSATGSHVVLSLSSHLPLVWWSPPQKKGAMICSPQKYYSSRAKQGFKGGGSWKLSGVKQTCNKGRKTVLQFSVHVVVWSVSFPQLKLDERCRRWCGFSQHQPGFQAAGVFYLLFFFITKPQTRLFKIIVRNPVIAHFQSHCGSFSSS